MKTTKTNKTKLSIVNYQLSILLILAAFLAPVKMQADTASQLITTIKNYSGNALNATLSGSNIVTVTGTYMGTAQLSLNIDANVTVLWQATLAGNPNLLLLLTGSGTFELATGGAITAIGDNVIGVKNDGSGLLKVSGGTITATKTNAIQATGASSKVTITGGTISSTTGDAIFAPGTSCVMSVGGTSIVRSTDGGVGIILDGNTGSLEVTGTAQVTSTSNRAIHATGTSPKITVSGGTVSSNAGDAAIYANGASATITVSGGAVNISTGGQSNAAIEALGTNAAITVSGGTVSTISGNAIYTGSSNSKVTVSNTGKVQATASFGVAITALGSVEVKDNAQISAIDNPTIGAYGSSSTTVTVSGGTVSSSTSFAISANTANVTVSGTGIVKLTGNGGEAISTNGSVEIKDNAQVITSTGIAIAADGVTVSGTGKVTATGDKGSAISTWGNADIKDNAQVSATTGAAIIASNTSSIVTVSGGTVSATAGQAISTTGSSSIVRVSSGIVKATTGIAVSSTGASAIVTVNGGAVFAYGSAIAGDGNVIYTKNNPNGFTGATGAGVVIAWNQAAGNTTYALGTTNDIIKSPDAATAVWANDGTNVGISYKNSSNTGIIPLSVTIPVCEIVGGSQYASFSSGLAATTDGKTLRLLTDITYNYGITVSGKSITFDLNGKKLNVTNSNTNGIGLNVTNSGKVNLLSATNGELNVTGYLEGVYADANCLVTVTNVHSTGNNSVAANANGGEIIVTGDLTATASNDNGTGAYAIGSGKITVNGKITVPSGSIYIYLNGVYKTAADFTTPTTNPGYLTYTDGSNTVWVRGETYANLYAAVQGETNAYAHYTAFAAKATAEGYPAVACLFRATADADRQHATDEWVILATSMGATDLPVADTPVVGTTAENLQAAFNGETYEWTTMYPSFLATAQAEGETGAARIFNLARQAEQVHAGNYSDVLSKLDDASYLNSTYATLYRCPLCGEVVTALPSRCPICGTEGSTFVIYDTTTGIMNADIQSLNIFPNPAKDELCITAESQINKVEIYNMDGKMLMQENNFAGKMNVSSLAKGLYIVKIYINGEAAIRKMIKN